jgi:3-dehydroquinate synthase
MNEYCSIRVTASASYNVFIVENGLNNIGDYIKKEIGVCRLAMLTDDKVDALYTDTVMKSLEKSGMVCSKYVIPNGERSKNTDNVLAFINFMAENHITRSDAVIALGGGVIGDMAGFASAIYQRGIKYIQIPTTLLAAVDSSIGGKTAVDIPSGKNLIGAFHQPSLVYLDTATLNTLDPNVLRDGYAEVIKYGVILDENLFKAVSEPNATDIKQIIKRCIEIKRDVVAADEFDQGMRGLLNFGHTIGHAIEKLSDYTVSHGEAVAKGMVRAAAMGAKKGLGDFSKPIIEVLKRYGFDLSCPYSAKELFDAALSDKKCQDDGITLILPQEIGKCGLFKVTTKELLSLLKTKEQL